MPVPRGHRHRKPWIRFCGFYSVPSCRSLTTLRLKNGTPPTGPTWGLTSCRRPGTGFSKPITAVAAPSYSLTSVKRVVQSSSSRPIGERTGKGAGWGLAIHRVLAALAADPLSDLELLVANTLAKEERTPEEKDEALLLLKGITQSPLWQRLSRSSRRYMEIPFSTAVTDDALGIPVGTVVNGVIDLVFEEAEGWVIADTRLIPSAARRNCRNSRSTTPRR